jgi:hypothetical protein
VPEIRKKPKKLIVLAPGMAAFSTPEEPDFALISRPKLAKPPEGKVVLALGAPDLDSWHGVNFFILIIHDHDLFFLAQLLGLHLVISINIPDIPALPAFELTPG